MNADEIVKALRWLAKETEFIFAAENLNGAADLIENLTAQLTDYHHMEQLVDGKMAENQRLRRINENLQEQLAASQRREKAAREDLNSLARFEKERCAYCLHDEECEPGEMLCSYKGDKAFEWRGPQDAD